MSYSTAEDERKIDAVVDTVKSTKKRIALTRQGKPIVAIVPMEDLEYLEALEAQEDAEDIEACKAAKNEPIRPFEEVKKELGL